MTAEIIRYATMHGLKSIGNALLNGFASDISVDDRVHQVGVRCKHFQPVNRWESKKYSIVDMGTGEKYCHDSKKTVRQKCGALFGASLVVQPIALTCSLLNRIGKVVTFAQLWNPSKTKAPYSFKARILEWVKDLFLIVATPFLLLGLIFAALYGAIARPYDGRKLFGTFERIAYSGGYQFFKKEHDDPKQVQNYLLAPCFQPEPVAHLGGGDIKQPNVW